MIATSIIDLVGNTPLLELRNIEKMFNLNTKILAKLEYLNPAGSTKDRAAKFMIEQAIAEGKINKNTLIIEPTSGNTGVGLAAIAASYGLKVVLTMPETMSIERQQLLKLYGAKIVLTPGEEGMAGAVKKANELAKEVADSFIPGQFENPNNPLAHEKTTGPEIWRDTKGEIAAYFACIGTGGTLSGTGRFLKSQNKDIKIIGVEPEASPLISKGYAGSHKIQGIGANFVPKNLDLNICDLIKTVSDSDAFDMTHLVSKNEGVLLGISSGAALSAALSFCKENDMNNKTIVVHCPDTGDRYLSVL